MRRVSGRLAIRRRKLQSPAKLFPGSQRTLMSGAQLIPCPTEEGAGAAIGCATSLGVSNSTGSDPTHFSSGEDWRRSLRSSRANAVSDVFRLHTINGLEWIDVQGTLTPRSSVELASTISKSPPSASTASGPSASENGKGVSPSDVKARLFRPHSDLAFMTCVSPLLEADGVHPRLIKDAERRIILPQCKVFVPEDEKDLVEPDDGTGGKDHTTTSSTKPARACLLVCRFPIPDHAMLPPSLQTLTKKDSSTFTAAFSYRSGMSSNREGRFEELLFDLNNPNGKRGPGVNGPQLGSSGTNSGESRSKLWTWFLGNRRTLNDSIRARTSSAGIGEDSVLRITTRLTIFVLPESGRMITCHRAPINVISKMRNEWNSEGYCRSTTLLQLINYIMKGCVEMFVSSASQHTLWLDQFETSLFPNQGRHFEDNTSSHTGWRGLASNQRISPPRLQIRRRTQSLNQTIESVYCINRRASVFCRLLQPLPYAYSQVVAATTNNRSVLLLNSDSQPPVSGKAGANLRSALVSKPSGNKPSKSSHKTEQEAFLAQDVAHHCKNALTMCEDLRDSSQALLSLHFQLTSNELEELVRVITLVSSVFIPLSFICSMFGMEFSSWESFYSNPFGIWVALSLMGFATFSTWFWVWWKYL
jgi:Mg2+ and Co2+ transporter CorA